MNQSHSIHDCSSEDLMVNCLDTDNTHFISVDFGPNPILPSGSVTFYFKTFEDLKEFVVQIASAFDNRTRLIKTPTKGVNHGDKEET